MNILGIDNTVFYYIDLSPSDKAMNNPKQLVLI